MRLSSTEMQTIRDEIFFYLNELEDRGEDDLNFTIDICIPGDDRFLAVQLIINVFEGQNMFWPVNVCLIDQDEYLDVLSSNNKNQKE